MASQKAMIKMSIFAELYKFVKPYYTQTFLFLVALVITAGVTLAIGQGLKLVIDEGFNDPSYQRLNEAVFFLVTASVIMALGIYCRLFLISWLSERVSADIRTSVFNHLISLHPSFFELNRSGDIMSRLTTDTTLLQSILGTSFSLALRSFIMLIGATIMLFITNLKLSLIVIFVMPIVVLPIIYFGRRVRNLAKKSQDRVASVGTYAGEVIQQIKTVQSFTQEPSEIKAFNEEVESAFKVARRRIAHRSALTTVVVISVYAALSAMLWFGGHGVLSGEMTGGELGAFVFYASLMAMGMASVSEVYGELQRAAGATERLIELLNAKSEIFSPVEAKERTKNIAAQLNFVNVNFSYPSRPSHLALNQLSISIDDGKIIALVGPSGAGKSTIFSLIQRFYDPQSGSILFGKHDLRALDLRELRKEIAVVEQQPTLFTGSVMYNIKYGRPEASDDEAIEVAKLAFADEFIREFPEGYDSNLGEKGVRLSGGQRQRIAIARALLKNPRILLLDEATSALDSESEHKVQRALENLMSGRTTVIIAHRLSTILHADRIIVMDKGKAIATGKHHELIESNALYARLAELQFSTDALAPSVE